VVDKQNNASSLTQSIQKIPTVARALSAASAVRDRVSITRSQKELTIQGTGSSGVETKTSDSSEGILVVGVTAQKLLNDNGQTDRSIYLSELGAEIASLESQVAFDKALQQILEAYTSQNHALKIENIITNYVNQFNKREKLVQTAVNAGVLSNSDYLELQSLKNEVLSQQSQSVFQSNSSSSYLKTSLSNNYTQALAELEENFEVKDKIKLSTDGTYQITLLNLNKLQLQTQIKLQEAANSFTTSWHTTASSPKSRGAGSTIFAGITMGLPFKDGGKAKASIVALNKELEVNALDVSTYIEVVSLAQQGLDNFESFHQKQSSLLNERMRISKDHIDELELKLKAGRVDVSVLAKEILTLARAEIAIERLKHEYVTQKLSALAATGQSCQAVNLCDAKNFGNSE
ncbi:TolC family protein, partial [bacterium]|nr:TolC family protein [bacterium]